MNGPMDRVLDIDGFDDRRRHVCRFQPRCRTGLVAVGGDTASVCESNAGDDRRKSQFHDVLVHVTPPFVLTERKEGTVEESDIKAFCHFPLFAKSGKRSRRQADASPAQFTPSSESVKFGQTGFDIRATAVPLVRFAALLV